MKIYETPIVKIEAISINDVITTSGEPGDRYMQDIFLEQNA